MFLEMFEVGVCVTGGTNGGGDQLQEYQKARCSGTDYQDLSK